MLILENQTRCDFPSCQADFNEGNPEWRSHWVLLSKWYKTPGTLEKALTSGEQGHQQWPQEFCCRLWAEIYIMCLWRWWAKCRSEEINWGTFLLMKIQRCPNLETHVRVMAISVLERLIKRFESHLAGKGNHIWWVEVCARWETTVMANLGLIKKKKKKNLTHLIPTCADNVNYL